MTVRKNLFDLTGKVALVTGGNGGIGLGMAEELAMHGATVVIWGNKPEKNEQALEALHSFGGEVRCRQVDVSNEIEVKTGIGAIIDEFGRIDQAIANAGIRSLKKLSSISPWKISSALRGNVHGVFFTLREAARHMLERGMTGDVGGSLVSMGATSFTRESINAHKAKP